MGSTPTTHRFTAGLGFLGIAVALLGRNRPVGIALGALLFGFLDRAAVPLDFADFPASVVTIIQGTIVLSVVVANEVARRLARRPPSAEGRPAAPRPPPHPTRRPARWRDGRGHSHPLQREPGMSTAATTPQTGGPVPDCSSAAGGPVGRLVLVGLIVVSRPSG